MAAPCGNDYESEARDKITIDPMVAKAFYKKAKEHYDSGKDFNDTVTAMHKDTGLQEATIGRILTSDKRLKSMTTDMWLKQAKYREISQAAEELVNHADTAEWAKRAGQAWDLSRRSATLYHGGVFPFTHMRNLLFSGSPKEMGIFFRTVKRAYSYATPNTGKARWARDMALMQTDPAWKEAVRMGVEAKPSAEPVGILSSGVKGWGRRGFDALKPARVELFKLWKDNLPDNFRDEESGRQLAKDVNVATGAVKLGKTATRVLPKISFAPKLWLAKRMEAFAPLARLAKEGSMTPQERAVSNIAMKRWAKIVGVTGSILAANDAFNKYVLKNDKRVNFGDMSSPGTLWRMNVGGWIIPLSPLTEVIRAPVAMVGALMATKKQLHGNAPLSLAGQIAMKEFLNSLHPSLTGLVEGISGREVFGRPGHLRRLPFPGAAQLVRGEEREKDQPMSYTEYFLEKGPIPISGGTREFVQALKDEGVGTATAETWVKALMQSALSGGVGVHAFQQSAPQPKSSGRRSRGGEGGLPR